MVILLAIVTGLLLVCVGFTGGYIYATKEVRQARKDNDDALRQIYRDSMIAASRQLKSVGKGR